MSKALSRFSNEQKVMSSASSYGLPFKKFVGEGEWQGSNLMSKLSEAAYE